MTLPQSDPTRVPQTNDIPSGQEDRGRDVLRPYHKPALVHYGPLSEITQMNPSVGSDGGVGDCTRV